MGTKKWQPSKWDPNAGRNLVVVLGRWILLLIAAYVVYQVIDSVFNINEPPIQWFAVWKWKYPFFLRIFVIFTALSFSYGVGMMCWSQFCRNYNDFGMCCVGCRLCVVTCYIACFCCDVVRWWWNGRCRFTRCEYGECSINRNHNCAEQLVVGICIESTDR